MNRIKNYNQKLLAILGTILTVIAIFGLINISKEFYKDFIRNWDQDIYREEGILSEKKVEELRKENKRQELISFELPKLIDSVNSIYIIPVTHKSLDEPEEIYDAHLFGIAASSSNKVKTDERYSSYYYGSFNNLLIYDQKNGISNKLFDERVNFEDIKIQYFKDDILVIFKAALKDTFKDDVINLIDYKKLFIYSIKEKRLRQIGLDNTDISKYNFINKSKDILIQFGLDKNENGKYEDNREPSTIRKYNFKKDKLETVINKTIIDDLQKSFEGTKK